MLDENAKNTPGFIHVDINEEIESTIDYVMNELDNVLNLREEKIQQACPVNQIRETTEKENDLLFIELNVKGEDEERL